MHDQATDAGRAGSMPKTSCWGWKTFPSFGLEGTRISQQELALHQTIAGAYDKKASEDGAIVREHHLNAY